MIGIIMQTQHGKFVPMVGREVGDGDSIFNVIGQQPPQDTAELAAAFIISEQSITEKLLTPVKSTQVAMMGTIWLDTVRKKQSND